MRQSSGTFFSVPSANLMSASIIWRGFRLVPSPWIVTLLITFETERFPARAGLESQRQNAHADQVRAMDALEGFGDDGAHAEKPRALRRPVARRSIAISGAGEDDERHALGLVFHGRVEDRHFLAIGPMPGQAAFRHRAIGLLEDEILDADIGEGAAHHNFVIAAPRAVLVEIGLGNLMLEQIFARPAKRL